MPEFPLPGITHGNRILVSVIEHRARTDPNSSWVSVPVDETDLSRGYKEITFERFNNAVNHAVYWLQRRLPVSDGPFQPFAYAGPKDLRYPILAAAAGKLQKVMVLPSPLITPEAQRIILDRTRCRVYIRPASMAASVDAIVEDVPDIQRIDAPELADLLGDTVADPYEYPKSWEEGKDDPWMVFHTSGTTGHPKPVIYTHRMMATFDTAASLPDIEEAFIHHAAMRRWYTPLPSLHTIGMMMVLAMTAYFHTTIVGGPPTPPTPDTIVDIIKYGRVESALLTPALIDQISQHPPGLSALRTLQFVSYGGAPLSRKTGSLLAPYVHLAPAIGSTESCGYFTTVRRDTQDWEYVGFQAHAGAVLEQRSDTLHELVFVRRPECKMQQIFALYPDRDRFETNDLWIEHPTRKGLWKIVGRTDDYVYLSHGDGLHASSLEPEIERHPRVRAALIGGHGRPSPVLLVELHKPEDAGESIVETLRPYIDRVNEHCHECVRLAPERVIIASKDRPFVRTVKGSVARLPSLKLYETEISKLFDT